MTLALDSTAPPPLSEDGFTDSTTATTMSSLELSHTAVENPAAKSLERQQRARALRGLTMIAGMSSFGALALRLVDERQWAHTTLTWALVGLSVVAVVQLVRVQKGFAYDRSYVVLSAALVTLAAAAYVGLFSLVIVPLPIIVLFAGQDRRPATAWGVYSVCAVGIAALALLSFAGILDQTSTVLSLQAQPGRRLLSLTLFNELILAVAFAMALRFRKSTDQAMRDLAEAHGAIRQREALLSEARADVERWNAAGRSGRFTGSRVGPFQVGELAGRGGMGDVYLAEHTELEKPVALKILHEHLRADGDALQRFFREARITSDLESPHIVAVLMTGTTDRGAPFLAMERLTGRDLATILRQEGALSLLETVALVRDVGRALAAAHAAGIVHRDIKPQNLFHCTMPDGSRIWKVLDFGISKINESASTLTQGKIVGTPGYMAPEQARGDAVDERADICALAIVAYRALTGRSPFRGKDSTEVIHALLLRTPPCPSDYADLPEDVDLVLAIALAKNREHRFETVEAFARAFESAAASRLDPALRERARTRLEAAPWGSEVSASIARRQHA